MKFGSKLAIATVALAFFGSVSSATAQDIEANGPLLFGNQYTQGYANQATAQMYVAPKPVPAWVGHTYYTYQPFYPHELMYGHTNRYHNYYDNGNGLNRTRVHYSTAPVASAIGRMFKAVQLPHRY